MASVEGILRRLKTDYLDILLLHRPDPLVQPEEVARAFAALYARGDVRYFGVSNHTAAQIDLLRKTVELHAPLINEGIIANQENVPSALASGTLDYCRSHDMLIQAWSPLAKGKLFNPPDDAEEKVKQAADVAARLAEVKQTRGGYRAGLAVAASGAHPARHRHHQARARPGLLSGRQRQAHPRGMVCAVHGGAWGQRAVVPSQGV
jgi:predicted oxidoreductase